MEFGWITFNSMAGSPGLWSRSVQKSVGENVNVDEFGVVDLIAAAVFGMGDVVEAVGGEDQDDTTLDAVGFEGSSAGARNVSGLVEGQGAVAPAGVEAEPPMFAVPVRSN